MNTPPQISPASLRERWNGQAPKDLLELIAVGGVIDNDIKIECAPEKVAQVQMLMPRISDSFTRFLSDIDPAAIDRRGVLEIIRAELRTRADMVLGSGVIDNILITEFAIQ